MLKMKANKYGILRQYYRLYQTQNINGRETFREFILKSMPVLTMFYPVYFIMSRLKIR